MAIQFASIFANSSIEILLDVKRKIYREYFIEYFTIWLT